MKTRVSTFLFIVLAGTLFSASLAKADTVSVQITGVSGGVQGGVYTSPYYGTVGDIPNVPLVCDDYGHQVYMYESWTASVSTFADLSNTRFWQGSQAATLVPYDQAAYLFNQLYLHPSQSGDISFALWAIFDASQVETSAGWDKNAAWWLANARKQTFTPGEFSNFKILTPVSPTSPQEYLVRTPEPSTVVLLTFGVSAIVVFGRRKMLTNQC